MRTPNLIGVLKKWYKPQNNFYKILGNVNIQKKILIFQIF